jgi:hypothetical protein
MLWRGKHSNSAASAAVSALFGDKPTVDPLSTTDGCWCAAVGLFSAIRERHGTAQAERIFRKLGAPTGRQREKLQDAMLLSFVGLLHQLHGIKKIQQAARYIAEHNAKLRNEGRKEDCLGPSGSTSEDALRQHLGRLIDDYPDEAISKLLRESKNGKPAKTSGVARPVSRKQKARPKR